MRPHWAGWINRAASRELASGGFAAIDVTAIRKGFWRRRYSAALVVERRADRARRIGHEPPIIAWSIGGSVQSVVRRLLPIMQNDALLDGYVPRLD